MDARAGSVKAGGVVGCGGNVVRICQPMPSDETKETNETNKPDAPD